MMAFIMYDAMGVQAYDSGELNDIFQDLMNGYSLIVPALSCKAVGFGPKKQCEKSILWNE